MVIQEHSIFHIDPNILSKVGGNKLHALFEQYFNADNQLIFSLLNLTEIQTTGIGQTHIYGNEKNLADDFYERYRNIIRTLNENIPKGIYSYKEWFENNTWKLIEETNTHLKSKLPKEKLGWKEFYATRDKKQYAIASGLKPEAISKYIESYISEMEKLVLKMCNFHYNIIYPFANVQNNILIPRGNFHIHIGTKTQITHETIHQFMHHLREVWHELYGGFDHATLMENFISFSKVRLGTYSDFIPQNLNKARKDIYYLFIRYFSKKENIERFENLKKNFLEKLAQSYITDKYDGFNFLRSVPTVAKLVSNYTDRDFENYIFKRAFAIFLLVCKNKDIDDIKFLLRERDTSASAENRFFYFDHNLHLHISSTVGTDALITNLKKYLLHVDHDLTSGQLRVVRNFTNSLSLFEIEIIKMF